MRTALINCLFITLLSTAANANDIYRWVDKQGVTHFSTQPPTQQPSERLGSKGSAYTPADSSTPEHRPIVDTDAIAQRTKQKIAAEEKIRLEYCQGLAQDIAQLENNPRVRVTEDDGSMRRITEEERQSRIQTAKTDFANECQN